MFTPLRRRTMMFCLLALTSLTPMSIAQNLCTGTTPCVTTWHNDNNRTGWQQNETSLTTTGSTPVSQTNFGLLWQWPVTGRVYAQPLAVANVPTGFTNCKPSCNLVFVATEQDMLYAFNAAPSAQPPNTPLVWSLNLAQQVNSAYTAVNCSALTFDFGPCDSGDGIASAPPGGGVVGPYVGVTGTPVIDTSGGANNNTLYVVAAVAVPSGNQTQIFYYLFAVDITKGQVRGTPTQILGSVTGNAPPIQGGLCTSDYPTPGTVLFDSNHIQRSGLLLMPNGQVYVAFAPAGHEIENGWMFAYSFNSNSGIFTQTAKFNSTPWGTGGGIWGSGAGPASDGTDIYTATGNGTLFDTVTQNIPYDIGDALLKLNPGLTVIDFYAPPDGGRARCINDLDFGSGGVLVVPSPFTYNTMSVLINADKESNLYVTNQATGSMGKFNGSSNCTNTFNNIQCITTPAIASNDKTQGYWGSPAYWSYTPDGVNYTYMLYYSADAPKTVGTNGGPGTAKVAPMPVNGYQLATGGSSGPIPSTFSSTSTLFCGYSPTPSVSSNAMMPQTGIVWAIESNQNKHNNGTYEPPDCAGSQPTGNPGALHAFCATAGAPGGPCPTALTELYSSRNVQTPVRHSNAFTIPTISNGQVYMGTEQEVDVFGLCSNGQNGKCQP
jgi:hypothetical protein